MAGGTAAGAFAATGGETEIVARSRAATTNGAEPGASFCNKPETGTAAGGCVAGEAALGVTGIADTCAGAVAVGAGGIVGGAVSKVDPAGAFGAVTVF